MISELFKGVTSSSPISEAWELKDRASKQGFEWENSEQVENKIKEELDEFLTELGKLKKGDGFAKFTSEEELGDLLFSIIDAAHFHKINPENALRHANIKFKQRYSGMEASLNSEGKTVKEVPLKTQIKHWNKLKG